MDNGNYTPIYHQLSGNNYMPPTYLPQTQQIQQLDYNYANDYPSVYSQFHQNSPVPLTVVPSPSVVVQGERLLLTSKYPLIAAHQQIPSTAHNVQSRQRIDRVVDNTVWIKQETIPSSTITAASAIPQETSELAADLSDTTNPSFSQVFTEAVLKKGIKEQFVKKTQNKSPRKKSDTPPKPRTRNPSTWKRNKTCLARLRGEEYESKRVMGLCEVTGKQIFTNQAREARRMKPPCKPHRNTTFECQKFTEEIRQGIFDNFWKVLDWEQRKLLVCNHVEVEAVKTTYVQDEKQQRRFVNVKHYLDIDGESHLVCKALFHGTFGISLHTTQYWLIGLNGLKQKKSVCLAKLVSGAEKPVQRRLRKRDKMRMEMLKNEDSSQVGDTEATNSEFHNIDQDASSISDSQQSMRRFSKQQEEIGPPCNCRSSTTFTKDCSIFTDEIRTKIFNNFWNFMDYNGRKSFFLEYVNVIESNEQKRDFFLPIDGMRHPVCQRLFLSTLGIGRYSCRFWLTLVGILPEHVENKIDSDTSGDLKTKNQNNETESTSKLHGKPLLSSEGQDLRKKNPMGQRCRCKLQNTQKRKCLEFTENIRRKIHFQFWCVYNVLARKEFLRKHVEVELVKSHRAQCLNPDRRQRTVQYYLSIDSERLSVCHSLFHATLGFTKNGLRQRLLNAGIFKPTETKIDFVAIDNYSDTDVLMDEEEPIDTNEFYYEIPDMDLELEQEMETELDLELEQEMETELDLELEQEMKTEQDLDCNLNLKLELVYDLVSETEPEPERQPKRTKTVCDYLSELINQISKPVLKLTELNLDDFSHLPNYSDIQQQLVFYKNKELDSEVDITDDNCNVETAFIDVERIKKEINYDD